MLVVLWSGSVLAADNKVIWLDEMNLSQAVSGFGGTQAKKAVANKPLTLRGKVYERGIGTHAPGALRIDLDKRAELLAEACKLRRKVAFANPLLDFNRILFIKRHFCPNEEVTGNHK